MLTAAQRSSTRHDTAAPAAPDQPAGASASSFPIPKAWGSRRLLGFLNVSGGAASAGGRWGIPPRRPRVRPLEDEEELAAEDDGGIEAVRAKLMFNLREAAERVTLAVGSGQEREAAPAPAPEAPEPVSSSAAAEAARPWNLRKAVRRVTRYGFEQDGVAAGRGGPARPGRARPRDPSRRPAFSVSLSKQEIAEDIYALTGALPRQRPRKRSRAVQLQLDDLFPGSWLAEITPDAYKVSD